MVVTAGGQRFVGSDARARRGKRAFLVYLLLWFAGTGFAARNDRVSGAIETGRAVRLQGSVRPEIRRATDRGALEPGMRISGMTLVLAQSDGQRADLERFLEAQRDPSSPDYRNWLTPEQYGERFGLSESDLGGIVSWLQSQGFTIGQVARGRGWIAFDGTAGQVAQAFHTELHHFEIAGETHFANAAEAWIPASLDGIVSEIRGLDDFRPKPQRATARMRPEFNASNGSHYLTPGDLAAIYDIQALYDAGFDGTGQKLVVVGQTSLDPADIRAFRSEFNLPPKDPEMVLFGPNPGANRDDRIEADLDIEWAGAVARNAAIVYVYSQNAFESLQYAVDRNLAPVIGMSYGECELAGSTSFRTLAQQANAEGITWLSASGDSGAAGCDEGDPIATHGPAVTFPASIPEVTAVGGTEFDEQGGDYWSARNGANSESAVSWIPETAWNDTPLGSGLISGGGGASHVFAKPWWQTGQGVPNDNARDVPDVSLTASAAHDGYVIYAEGSLQIVGGTSATTPAFAGIVSILNQYLAAKGAISQPGLGNINPALYNLAQNTKGLFHDVASGDNVVPCAIGSVGCVNGSFGYSAGTGYDLATGLGSVDAFELVTKWASLQPSAGTAMTLTASPASIAPGATAQLTAVITAESGMSTPTGTVTFALGNIVLGSAAAIGTGPAASATIAVPGANLAPGANAVTAGFAATANGTNSTATATVFVSTTVTATSTTIAASPASLSRDGSTVLTAIVKSASGMDPPAGTVVFKAGTATLGTANLAASASGAVATLSANGPSLAVGVNTITGTYMATGNFNNSSGSVMVTVTAPTAETATATALVLTPAVIAASATAQIVATVKPLSGTGTPEGTVTFSAGGKTLGTAALLNSTATLAVQGSALYPGSNSIVATYQPGGSFGGSTSAPATLVVAAPAAIVTNTAVMASPAIIEQTSSTVLTATVNAAAGSGGPSGSVSFAAGDVFLGSAPVTVRGNVGTAVLAVLGSRLIPGANNITASFAATTGGFANSASSVTVNVMSSRTATTTAVSASRGATGTSTTVLTATVRAASGNTTPVGSVIFALGSAELGMGTLTGYSGTATATLTLNNADFPTANAAIEAYYPGRGDFTGSTGSVTVPVR